MVMDFDDAKIKTNICKVLEHEKSGIDALMRSLDDKVIEIVKRCHACSGKVVFIGMGKSGHVARKISATMSSLGTPSFFLHPAEAAHGDLGMLQKTDVVIMVSNSGETEELIQLVPTIKLLDCTLIGVFCKEHCTLSRYCNVAFTVPVQSEACANNLAPTTSTTAVLALGDAIAVTLSELNHFSEKDFALFHPRGALGKKLLVTVDDLARNSMVDISVKPNQTIEEILFVITKNHLGAVAVTNEADVLVGIVSDGDIRRLLEKKKEIWLLSVEEVMTKNARFVEEGTLAADAFKLMRELKISVLPIVTKDKVLVGMISLHEIISEGIH